jgi:hypothetical protein
MKRIALSGALIICLAGAVLPVSGCQLLAQKSKGTTISGATGGAVNATGDPVTIKGKDGAESTVSKDVKIPPDFPAAVPLRGDASVKAVLTNKAPNGGTAYMVNARFKIPEKEVLDWYKAEFEKAGWTITTTVTAGDGGMVAAEKDNLVVNVVTAPETREGFTSVIAMQVGPKGK